MVSNKVSKVTLTLFLTSLLLLSYLATMTVMAVPQQPHQFYGSITINVCV